MDIIIHHFSTFFCCNFFEPTPLKLRSQVKLDNTQIPLGEQGKIGDGLNFDNAQGVCTCGWAPEDFHEEGIVLVLPK